MIPSPGRLATTLALIFALILALTAPARAQEPAPATADAGALVKPPPWSEFWAQHPLSQDPTYEAFPVSISQDTHLSQYNPSQNFGGLDSGLIGDGGVYAGLVKIDPASLPRMGTQPIAKIHLALPLAEVNSMDAIWIGVLPACRSWSESTATWNNASCNSSSLPETDWVDRTAQWMLLDLWRMGFSAEGYYLAPAQSQGKRPFFTREAGAEWTPRLIVTYRRDTSPPKFQALFETDKPLYLRPTSPNSDPAPPATGVTVDLLEDVGIRSVDFEKTVVTTGQTESSTQVMENQCQLAQGSRIEVPVYPFDRTPLGRRLSLRLQATDCNGKASDPLVLPQVYLVERVESAILRDFTGQSLGVPTTVQRAEDRQNYPELPPSGADGSFPSISDEPSFWVEAPGYEIGADHVLAVVRDPGLGVNELYVPWHGSQTLHPAGASLTNGAPLEIPLAVPQAARSILATIGALAGDENAPGAHLSFTVTPAADAPQLVGSTYLRPGKETYAHVDLAPWAGQSVTVTLATDSSAPITLDKVALSPQNPEFWVSEQTVTASTTHLRQGITVTVPYSAAILPTAVTSVLTVSVPSALSVTQSAPGPTQVITETGRVLLRWELPAVSPPGGAVQIQVQGNQAGKYDWEVQIFHPQDPYRDNNQAQIRLQVADHLLYLPTVIR